METQIFHHAKKQKPDLQKNPLKETKIFQDIITLYQVSTQAKILSFKNHHIKIDPLFKTVIDDLSIYN